MQDCRFAAKIERFFGVVEAAMVAIPFAFCVSRA
jgi:hypothetical protein